MRGTNICFEKSSVVDRAASRDLTLTNREAKYFRGTAYDPLQVGNDTDIPSIALDNLVRR
jgi:hypothetical protein